MVRGSRHYLFASCGYTVRGSYFCFTGGGGNRVGLRPGRFARRSGGWQCRRWPPRHRGWTGCCPRRPGPFRPAADARWSVADPSHRIRRPHDARFSSSPLPPKNGPTRNRFFSSYNTFFNSISTGLFSRIHASAISPWICFMHTFPQCVA